MPERERAVAPAACQRFIALDYGLKRTGLAVGSRLLGHATPQGSLHAQGKAIWPKLQAVVRDWQPDAFVVGVPRHPDGAPHEMTGHALAFARRLRGRLGLPVFEVDERYSSTEALASAPRDVDAAAACIILEQFFRSLDS